MLASQHSAEAYLLLFLHSPQLLETTATIAGSYSTCSSLCLDSAVFPASLFPNNSGLIEYSATDL